MGEVFKGIYNCYAMKKVGCEGPHRKGLVYGVTGFTTCLGEWRTFLAFNVESSTQEIHLSDWSFVLVSLL